MHLTQAQILDDFWGDWRDKEGSSKRWKWPSGFRHPHRCPKSPAAIPVHEIKEDQQTISYQVTTVFSLW